MKFSHHCPLPASRWSLWACGRSRRRTWSWRRATERRPSTSTAWARSPRDGDRSAPPTHRRHRQHRTSPPECRPPTTPRYAPSVINQQLVIRDSMPLQRAMSMHRRVQARRHCCILLAASYNRVRKGCLQCTYHCLVDDLVWVYIDIL